MRRALAILKYLPAVLCGLLVVAWQISVFFWFGVQFQVSTSAPVDVKIGMADSNLILMYFSQGVPTFRTTREHFDSTEFTISQRSPHSLDWTGYAANSVYMDSGSKLRDVFVWFPIPALLTLFLPLAVGCLIRFRFPLWSLFAFTALIAVELAHYLR